MNAKIAFTEQSKGVTATVSVEHENPETALELSKEYFDEAFKYAKKKTLEKRL